ncbi:MAG: hypothetical protein KA230_05175 [Flavobacteriales bacterium]|nr:hypothetical protein [Flavobacteriales bacterium]MBP6573818.1 hypothetical protein [Flavobacteriales bacterium]
MRRHFLIALGSLACAASIGALLRLIYVMDLPWLVFKPWLHAHSHVAMLGWVFPALLLTLLGQDDRKPPRGFLGWLSASQMMVLGMLVSFPLQGYDTFSITFSILQMLISYVLVGIVWISTAHWPKSGSRRLVRLAIILQVISTLGVWAMGPIMTHGLAGTEWYYWSIQWFLHFQFNGWFWFAAMAIGSRWAERHGVDVRLDGFTTALWVVSAVFTYALAIAWSERLPLVLAINTAGVALQFWAAWRTLLAMRRARLQVLVKTTRWMRILIGVMMVSMAAKVAAQTAVSIPTVTNMALTLRNYVIGFIHLNTLGAITALMFAHAVMRGWFNERLLLVRVAIGLFISGFALSELLLFLQGTLFWAGLGMMPGYYTVLLGFSMLLPIGVGSLLVHMLAMWPRSTSHDE